MESQRGKPNTASSYSKFNNAHIKVMLFCLIIGVFSLLPSIVYYNGVFLFRDDFIQQQVPFILETKRMLLGDIPFWSWNTFLGDNFIGSYAFYTIGSPFVWLILPLKEQLIPLGITLSILLKFMISGLTSYLYLRLFVKKDATAITGAILYTFSAFTIINTQFNHFMDVIAVFPLLLYSAEILFSKKKRLYGIFAFSVWINAVTNYYFFLSSCIVLLIYCIFRMPSNDWIKNDCKIWLALIFEGISGVLCATVILLPVFYKMIETPKIAEVGKNFDFLLYPTIILERIRALFMPIESCVRHAFYPGAASWSSTGAHLSVFGFTGALAYIVKNKNNWLSKLILTLIIISLIPVLNSVYVLFSNPEYTRWWYGLVLMLALATVLFIENMQSYSSRFRFYRMTVLIIGLLTIPFIVLYAAYANCILPNFISDRLPFVNMGSTRLIVYACLLTALHMLALRFILYKKPCTDKILIIVCILSVVSYSSFVISEGILSSGDKTRSIVNALRSFKEIPDENKDYRIDYDDSIPNLSLFRGMPSISSFHSVRHKSSAEFAEAAGYPGSRTNVLAVPDNESRRKLQHLLSVKYYYSYDKEYIPEGFSLKSECEATDVYLNRDFIPIGFTYSSYETLDRVDKEKLLDTMISALLLEKNTDILPKWNGAYLTIEESATEKSRNTCEFFKRNGSGFRMGIDLPRDNYVFVSVPYDSGFKAYVNGYETEIEKANVGFMAILAKRGYNEITVKYTVAGLKEGLYISLTSFILIALYIITGAYKKRHLKGCVEK